MSHERESDILDDDLWNATYPLAVFYVKYLAPLVLLLFSYAFLKYLSMGFWGGLKDIVPLFVVVIYSFFHWRAFNDLKNRRPYDAGTAQSIRPGDSLISARWAIVTAMFVHFGVVLGLSLYYFAKMKA